MTRKTLTGVVACLVLQLPCYSQTSFTISRPIALDKLSEGDLYALNLSGTVQRIAASGQLQGVSSFVIPSYLSPSDLTSSIVFGKPTLFIAATEHKRGTVLAYALDGSLQRTWTYNGTISGLDINVNAKLVYVAAPDTSEVQKIDLRQGNQKQTSFEASIVGARRLGPLIVDTLRNHLLLGDVDGGQIYELDLATHKSRIISSYFSSPQALLLSPDSRILYVADSSRRSVYSLDLEDGASTPRLVSALPAFKEPTGLANLGNGRIAVADEAASQIFIVDTTSVNTSDRKSKGTSLR